MTNNLYISNSKEIDSIRNYIDTFEKTTNKFVIDSFISSIQEVKIWFNENNLAKTTLFMELSRLILKDLYHFEKTQLFDEIFKYLRSLYKSNNLLSYDIPKNNWELNILAITKKTFEYLSDILKDKNYFIMKNYNIEKLTNYIDTFIGTENKFTFNEFVKNMEEIEWIYDFMDVEDFRKMMILTTHITRNLNNFKRTSLYYSFYGYFRQFCFDNKLIFRSYSALNELQIFAKITYDNLEFIRKVDTNK